MTAFLIFEGALISFAAACFVWGNLQTRFVSKRRSGAWHKRQVHACGYHNEALYAGPSHGRNSALCPACGEDDAMWSEEVMRASRFGDWQTKRPVLAKPEVRK